MRAPTPKSHVPWWMYVVAVLFILTFCFNARQEFWGPSAAGWIPAWPSLRVAAVASGTPVARAGLHAGDIVESVDGRSVSGKPDWFVARANFERPIEMQVRRGQQHLRLGFVIASPAWRIWRRQQALAVSAFYTARLILLLLAIFVAFSRPDQVSARLVALLFALAAVAEGYPSSGWAAALHALPGFLAILICLVTACWLLGAFGFFAFSGIFPYPAIPRPWRWGLMIAPLVIFLPPMVTSAIAMIYAPAALAKPWPLLLSIAPVRFAQDAAGVAPLLFFNVWLLELWLAATVLYLVAGFAIQAFNFRRLPAGNERRAVGSVIISMMILATVTLHNLFTRNWTSWFGTPAPAMFSTVTFAAEAALFLIVPVTLTYLVLTETPRHGNR